MAIKGVWPGTALSVQITGDEELGRQLVRQARIVAGNLFGSLRPGQTFRQGWWHGENGAAIKVAVWRTAQGEKALVQIWAAGGGKEFAPLDLYKLYFYDPYGEFGSATFGSTSVSKARKRATKRFNAYAINDFNGDRVSLRWDANNFTCVWINETQVCLQSEDLNFCTYNYDNTHKDYQSYVPIVGIFNNDSVWYLQIIEAVWVELYEFNTRNLYHRIEYFRVHNTRLPEAACANVAAKVDSGEKFYLPRLETTINKIETPIIGSTTDEDYSNYNSPSQGDGIILSQDCSKLALIKIYPTAETHCFTTGLVYEAILSVNITPGAPPVDSVFTSISPGVPYDLWTVDGTTRIKEILLGCFYENNSLKYIKGFYKEETTLDEDTGPGYPEDYADAFERPPSDPEYAPPPATWRGDFTRRSASEKVYSYSADGITYVSIGFTTHSGTGVTTWGTPSGRYTRYPTSSSGSSTNNEEITDVTPMSGFPSAKKLLLVGPNIRRVNINGALTYSCVSNDVDLYYSGVKIFTFVAPYGDIPPERAAQFRNGRPGAINEQNWRNEIHREAELLLYIEEPTPIFMISFYNAIMNQPSPSLYLIGKNPETGLFEELDFPDNSAELIKNIGKWSSRGYRDKFNVGLAPGGKDLV